MLTRLSIARLLPSRISALALPLRTSQPQHLRTMASTPAWDRLIRFVAEDGRTYLGQPIEDSADLSVDLGKRSREGKGLIRARTLHAEDGSAVHPWNAKSTAESKELTVQSLLAPLTKEEVNTIRCIGLNYKDHALEANIPLPDRITMFHKPRTALTGPWPAPVIVPKNIQDDQSDYESELCIVIGKDCRDVSEEQALDYVLGYTAANDISARKEQWSTSQWSRSKGFDHACPIGPCLVSAALFPRRDPAAEAGSAGGKVETPLLVKGRLNGKQMQDGSTKDLVFGVAQIVSFLSQGTTLEQGSIILTGTPAGVGTFFKPNIVLKDGDLFEVECSGGIGTLANQIVFEK